MAGFPQEALGQTSVFYHKGIGAESHSAVAGMVVKKGNLGPHRSEFKS